MALGATVLIFGIVGAFLLIRSFAASNSVAIEVEKGSESGPLTILPDNTASAGSAVRFNTGTTTISLVQPRSVGFAPFAYVAWGDVNMNDIRLATGVNNFFAAFILGSGNCTPAWDGNNFNDLQSPRAEAIAQDISSIRAAGGDVIISFGGQLGSDIAKDCPTTPALKTAYRNVIDRYGLTKMDFDIEGTAVLDTGANLRRAQALQQLQQETPELKFWLTLSVSDPGGLGNNDLGIIRQMKENGVVIAGVNIMVMDYGNDSRDMAQAAINAANSTFGQLKNIYGDSTNDATIWKAIGLIPMIGQNDTQPEVFTLENAQTLRNFAIQKGIGLMSMWSANRDESCPGNEAVVSDVCSGIPQSPNQFMNTLKIPALP